MINQSKRSTQGERSRRVNPLFNSGPASGPGRGSMLLVLGALLVAGHARAGDGPWLTFAKENERIVATDQLGVGDTQEKTYAWGDLNNNGWVDLAVVRRQPWSPGKRQNVLFMNEGGTLVDRTAEYAFTSDLPGDNGFLTPTSDVDVVLADLLNNGWIDLVTAATLNDGEPKHIGYPRVYVNLANDRDGNWQGFRFENDRIPVMLSYSGESGFNPRFEAVAAGDVTNNGFADLWFGDGDYLGVGGAPQPEGADFNDRLLVNQGAANPGFFTDATAGAFSGLVPIPGHADHPFPVSSTSWAVAIADINGNGLADIVKLTTVSFPHYIGAAYNNPLSPGVFTGGSYQVITAQGAPTDFSLADLNNNSRYDIVITDDGIDRYRLNLGTDASGHVVWGPVMTLPEQNVGFSGNSVVVDLDNNGWNDIIIADVHVGIPGCNRFTNIYRNRQDMPNVTFDNVSTIIPAAERQGVIDVAAFDITGNGWIDLVLGRCAGTSAWINQAPAVPCPGDLTGSGAVGVEDLLMLLSCWGPAAPGTPCQAADLDFSGAVGVNDLLILLGNWGSCL